MNTTVRDVALEPDNLTALWGALLAAAAFIVPFNLGSTSAMGNLVSELLLLAMGLTGLAGLIISHRKSIGWSLVEAIWLGVVLLAAISSLFSVYPVDAWRNTGFAVLIFIGFRSAFSVVRRDPGFPRMFFFAVAGSALLQALIGMHQIFFTAFYQNTFPSFYEEALVMNMRGGMLRATGAFVNANTFAAFLNIGLALVLACAFSATFRLWQRIACSVAGSFMLIAIYLSGSKAALGVSLLILAFFFIRLDKRLIVVMLALLLLLTILPNPIKDTVVRGVTGDPFFAMRPSIWMASLNMAAGDPLTGVGPGNYPYVSHRYAPPNDFMPVRFSRTPRIAHNSLLHTLAEYGLFVTAAVLLLLVYIFRKIPVALFRQRFVQDAPLAAGIAIALLGAGVHAMVDNIYNVRAILICAALLIPCFIAATGVDPAWRRDRKLRIPDLRQPLVLFVILLIISGFVFLQTVQPFQYERRIAQLQEGLVTFMESGYRMEGEDPIERLRGYEMALSELRDDFPGNLAVNRTLAGVQRSLFLATQDFQHFLDADRSWKRTIEALDGLYGADAYDRLLLHLDLIRLGYPKTEDLLLTLQELAEAAVYGSPNRALYYRTAAQIYREAELLPKAVESLKHATAIEPNYLQAYADIRQIAVLQEDDELKQWAEKQLEEARQRIQDASYRDTSSDYMNIILDEPR